MMRRWMVALFGAMVSLGPVLAQTPVGMPSSPPAVPVDRPVVTAPLVEPSLPLDSGERFWISADYLFSFIYGSRVTPLITTSAPGTPVNQAGVLGNPNTIPLFAGRVNGDERSGFRIESGLWFHEDRNLGVEGGFTIIESQSTIWSGYSNDGSGVLARPYFDALQSDRPSSVLLSYPFKNAGGADICVTSGNFYEAHLDFVENMWEEGGLRIDGMLGYRFYRYDEGLRIRQVVHPLDGIFVPGTQITTGDDFSTQNQFNGVEVGLRGTYTWDAFSFAAFGKIAAGNLHRRVKIYGGQQIAIPGSVPVEQVGGLYALSSNIGNYTDNGIGTLPELGCTLRWQFSDYLRFRVGYNVLFLPDVARADQQFSYLINPNLLPGKQGSTVGPRQPEFTNLRDNMWIQSLSLGMEFTY
ncbi:MAG: BBP7 family outer membrane beta-barrel protein [Gemmataceae bacterium]